MTGFGMLKILLSLILFPLSSGVPAHSFNYVFMEIYTDPETVLRFNLGPCSETNTILIDSTDLPKHTQNPYFVFIKNEFLDDSEAEVTLSSAATIYFDDERFDDFIRPNSNYTVSVRFNVGRPSLSFLIERVKPAVLPYITNLKINGVDFCKIEVITTSAPGGLEVCKYICNLIFSTIISYDYIERYKNFEQITLPVYDSFCGTRKVDHTGLIVNGVPTKPGDWPWHTAIYRIYKTSFNYICGGTLITKFNVLTAAHCVTQNGSPLLPDLLSVVLGKYHLRGGDTTAVDKEVYEVIIHDLFNSRELNNDIALLRLATKVEYNNYIQPACLWQSSFNIRLTNHVLGTVVGWGIDHTDQLSTQLQQAQIPMIKEVTCLKSNRAFFGKRLDDSNFCAGYLNGTSACNGDSGGGFAISIHGRYYVRGIMSTAVAKPNEAKCDPNQYVLFTDVDKYTRWIRAHIKQ